MGLSIYIYNYSEIKEILGEEAYSSIYCHSVFNKARKFGLISKEMLDEVDNMDEEEFDCFIHDTFYDIINEKRKEVYNIWKRPAIYTYFRNKVDEYNKKNNKNIDVVGFDYKITKEVVDELESLIISNQLPTGRHYLFGGVDLNTQEEKEEDLRMIKCIREEFEKDKNALLYVDCSL